ncbi:MAG: hypothetical protein ACXAE3_11875, partial [Candidatus Kariarchaeaceae archaeon]
EATYLAVFAQWDDPGLIPHLYLSNSTGDLVKNTDVTYVGGGFYEFTTSEVDAQNLLLPAEDEVYYLILQVTGLPFKTGPFDVDIFARYVENDTLPTPEPIFNQNLNETSGVLGIDTSTYAITEFPEFKIDKLEVQIYQGTNGTFKGKVSNPIAGPNTLYDEADYDALHILTLEEGTKVELELSWDGELDIDIFVFYEADFPFQENDLLRGVGSSPGPFFETGLFSADRSGDYYIYVDYVSGLSFGEILGYELNYEARDGPTLFSSQPKIQFPTDIFPDGTYGILITMISNFGFDFELRVEMTVENSSPFTFNVGEPSEGSTVEGDVTVSWSSSRPVSVDITLIMNEIPIQVGTQIEDTIYTFDTTIFANGDAILKLEATDGIYVIEETISITIDNSLRSTLPPIITTDPRNLSFPLISVLLGVILLIPYYRRSRY